MEIVSFRGRERDNNINNNIPSRGYYRQRACVRVRVCVVKYLPYCKSFATVRYSVCSRTAENERSRVKHPSDVIILRETLRRRR